METSSNEYDRIGRLNSHIRQSYTGISETYFKQFIKMYPFLKSSPF